MENEVVPTDDEINEMIARTDDEFELFQKMDIEREQARGSTTHRLMQEVCLITCTVSVLFNCRYSLSYQLGCLKSQLDLWRTCHLYTVEVSEHVPKWIMMMASPTNSGRRS